MTEYVTAALMGMGLIICAVWMFVLIMAMFQPWRDDQKRRWREIEERRAREEHGISQP